MEGNKIIGVFTVSFAAQNTDGLDLFYGTPGEFSYDFVLGKEIGLVPSGANLIIEGTQEDDIRLAMAMLNILNTGKPTGCTPSEQAVLDGLNELRKSHRATEKKNDEDLRGFTVANEESLGSWESYRILSQNCNDFTDAMVDIYVGFNAVGFITTGSDLVEELKPVMKERAERKKAVGIIIRELYQAYSTYRRLRGF